MKIILINYRYFVSGGPERYLFNLKALLENKGHNVIPFSIKYTKNESSEYTKYFVSSLGNEDEIYFKEHSWTINNFLKTLERTFYSTEVFNGLSNLIKKEKPDFAIVLGYLRKLSPSVLVALNTHNIPFLVRLSDFGMVCPNGHLIRDDKICELCINGSLFQSVIFRCVQNSYGVSFVNYLSVKWHHYRKYFDLIKYFVVPCNFTRMKMIEAGWDKNKLIHMPTFVFDNENNRGIGKKKQIIYIGRIESTKGVHLILEAIKNLSDISDHKNIPVIIVGSGDKEYIRYLHEVVMRDGLSNITFAGNVTREKVYKLLMESAISITPSLWYDNMPNSVLESLSCGTTVIASDHGSFPEIVKHGETGLLFKPNDSYDLAMKIKYLFDNYEICIHMGERGIDFTKDYNSPEKHYLGLMDLYEKLADIKSKKNIS